jgi:hypothetical protein
VRGNDEQHLLRALLLQVLYSVRSLHRFTCRPALQSPKFGTSTIRGRSSTCLAEDLFTGGDEAGTQHPRVDVSGNRTSGKSSCTIARINRGCEASFQVARQGN